MKATELRIGNLVEVFYGDDSPTPGWHIETVARIYEDKIYFKAPVEFHILYFSSDLDESEKCTRGIPLSVEMLTALGFSEKNHKASNDYGVRIFHISNTHHIHLYKGKYTWLGHYFNYVHQIQNLHFLSAA